MPFPSTSWKHARPKPCKRCNGKEQGCLQSTGLHCSEHRHTGLHWPHSVEPSYTDAPCNLQHTRALDDSHLPGNARQHSQCLRSFVEMMTV
jgi:hypothetical protein